MQCTATSFASRPGARPTPRLLLLHLRAPAARTPIPHRTTGVSDAASTKSYTTHRRPAHSCCVAASSSSPPSQLDDIAGLPDDALCLLRVLRATAFDTGRVNVPSTIALALQPNIDQLRSAPVALRPASSRPGASLPPACTLVSRPRKNGSFERHLSGINAYLRASGARVDEHLLLASVAAPPSSGSPAAAPPRLALAVLKDRDLHPAAYDQVLADLGSSRVWVGTLRELRQYLDSAARGSSAHQDAPTAPAAPAPRSPRLTRSTRPEGQQQVQSRLQHMLDAGLHADAVAEIAEWLAAPNSQKQVKTLPQRALLGGKVNVSEEFAMLFCPPGPRGVKPEPVSVPAEPVPPSRLLPHVVFRGSPRAGQDGYIEWTVQGIGAWLRGAGAEPGDVLLVRAVGVGRGAGGRGTAVRLLLVAKGDVGEAAFRAVHTELVVKRQ